MEGGRRGGKERDGKEEKEEGRKVFVGGTSAYVLHVYGTRVQKSKGGHCNTSARCAVLGGCGKATYSSHVTVLFPSSAFPSAATPASVIWLELRLDGEEQKRRKREPEDKKEERKKGRVVEERQHICLYNAGKQCAVRVRVRACSSKCRG